jgi:DNA-binding NtrC family response regulator
MTLRPSVLLVAPTPGVAATLFTWLTDAGCELTVVGSFTAAKQQLERAHALLISEVRLGEYNGLHLALRAQAHDIPAILIGDPDPVLQRDANQLGAVYLTRDLDRDRLLAIIEPITAASRTGTLETEARAQGFAATNLSFLSWSECGPPARPVRAAAAETRRGPLPS